MDDVKQKKIPYQKPAILDLGEVTPAHGGACISGNTAPGGPCTSGITATGGSCGAGTSRTIINISAPSLPGRP